MSTAPFPLLSLELRLRTLETQILGVPSSYAESSTSASRAHDKDKRPITRRVREVNEALERASAGSDALKRFINGYAQYQPLLTLPSDPAGTAREEAAADREGGVASADRPLSESDLLPDSVKVTMLLEAAGDIRAAERDLREVELLKARGVEGAGQLEEPTPADLLPLRPSLVIGARRAQQRAESLDHARKEVGDLMARYSEYTNTVSDLFLDLHHRLERMEEAVSRVERTRRKELAAQY